MTGLDEAKLERWRAETRAAELKRFPETSEHFTTASGIDIADLYTHRDVAPEARDELPGEFPFTRGPYASMYRSRMFTRRQVVGLGTARDANLRHKYVLAQGQTGLSNDFDLPTITGHDSDDQAARGEVGRHGVSIDTVHDMRDLMDGIPLDAVSTSMTINHPAPILLAMYLAVAEEQGIAWNKLRGTLQNDPLKEFFAQKTWALPPKPAVRVAADVIEFCARHVRSLHPISLCGYQTRDCGGTADQEIGFTFAAAIGYIEETLRRGIDIDQFAPRLSFLMYVHMDLLEEVAKFRAARRLWAGLLRDRFGARDPASWRFRVHVQTGAALLTAQQPENNIARGALQCLAAVLGGVQSMAISTYDEAYSIPSEKAQRIALRTQQIVAYESGVTHTPDPLGGSYYVEALTDELEERARGWIGRIEELGGMLEATESGWVEATLAKQAYQVQQRVETGEQSVVGVNAFTEGNEEPQDLELFQVDPAVEQEQIARLRAVRAGRDRVRVETALARVSEVAGGTDNVMPAVLDAVKAECSEGEIIKAMLRVWGDYHPTAVY
jgi:methylmalonyl-CoA mutase N-terminal domain/subunit